MKKFRFLSAVLFVSLLFVLLPATAKAAMWDVPVGVGPGESFRWVFVTSSVTQAFDSDIDYYNTFVNDAADAAATPITDVVGFSSIAEINWMAIASTRTTDAIDNIGVSTAGIYTPMGDLVANGTADMFDDEIYSPITFTETGEEVRVYVWTGTFPWGTVGDPLGENPSTAGITPETSGQYLAFGPENPEDMYSVYAISEDLTVVPVPGTLILAATGLLSSTLGLRRLRRKHQE